MRELLTWQSYHVDEATDGVEALEVAIVAQPDFIVTDLEMAVMGRDDVHPTVSCGAGLGRSADHR